MYLQIQFSVICIVNKEIVHILPQKKVFLSNLGTKKSTQSLLGINRDKIYCTALFLISKISALLGDISKVKGFP